MSKRKAGVNDIIYELDNDDIEISSEDEKDAKITRLDPKIDNNPSHNSKPSEKSCDEVINLDISTDNDCVIVTSPGAQNGGKTSPDIVVLESNGTQNDISPSLIITEPDVCNKKLGGDCNTTIYNEDIVIDSPASNSDLGVVGCENRTPLVTVRFKDKKLATHYKNKVKAFMLELMKLHDEENLTGSETETDLELDIWPEDLTEDDAEEDKVQVVEDSLFFVDTDPGIEGESIPAYRQNSSLISDITIPDDEPPAAPVRRGPICFNCEGNHPLRDCTLPRNNAKIAGNRKNMTSLRVGRYHVEDDQKYGHLIPGRISGHLRHALGLKRHELPVHIYRMRMLGYPPGWLEEARISHSGITMFDSSGNAILDPEEEEGELCEPGSKDKFDIKKILDFPGFNVQASSRYKEEAHLFNLPTMSEQDSKLAMLQMLAPNAMKAYKRKKLTIFPSASANNSLVGQAEMDLDSGDEVAEFPSVPPLPDEAPPPAPPPPPPPAGPPPPLSPRPPEPQESRESNTDDEGSDDIEVLEVLKVTDIPVPKVLTIILDDDDKSQSSGRGSPSLDDLEEKKQRLLDALKGDGVSDVVEIDTEDSDKEDKEKTDENKEETVGDKEVTVENKESTVENKEVTVENKEVTVENKEVTVENKEVTVEDKEMAVEDKEVTAEDKEVTVEDKEDKSNADKLETEAVTPNESTVDKAQATETVADENMSVDVKETDKAQDNQELLADTPTTHSADSESETPKTKTGLVKDTAYGTPVINVASSYTKLPSDDKFAKDISDVINFENLPNSVGKYKQISVLLKKVKTEVDRIQES